MEKFYKVIFIIVKGLFVSLVYLGLSFLGYYYIDSWFDESQEWWKYCIISWFLIYGLLLFKGNDNFEFYGFLVAMVTWLIMAIIEHVVPPSLWKYIITNIILCLGLFALIMLIDDDI